MKHLILSFFLLLGVFYPIFGGEFAVISTNHGDMTIELFPDVAPMTVQNFKNLVERGFYNNKCFYRVVKDYVIQAGYSLDGDLEQEEYVPAEFKLNYRPHEKGAVGLARDDDENSGSTEFYICHVAIPKLNNNYTVFGQVVHGLDVLDTIANVPVNQKWVGENNNIAVHEPVKPVTILSVIIKNKA